VLCGLLRVCGGLLLERRDVLEIELRGDEADTHARVGSRVDLVTLSEYG